MNQAPPTVQGPRILARASEVSDVLDLASRGRSLILTRRALRGFDPGTAEDLKEGLRDLGRHDDRCAGTASLQVFRKEGAEVLGDAPAWIDAGSRYEELVATLESQGQVDFIFCLDPWTALLLGRAGEVASGAQWVFISDVSRRKTGTHPDYWELMEKWFAANPYSAIIPKDVWDQAIRKNEVETPPINASRLHLQKPGAWQWLRISDSSPEKPLTHDTLFFLVRYSGSISHLRVFLGSLSRQDYPKEKLQCVVLAEHSGSDVQTYLNWFTRAHPELSVTQIDLGPGKHWKAELDRLLKLVPGAVLVLTGDHSVLPDKFARATSKTSRSKTRPLLFSVPLSLEATAHIITGNLDPLPNYENLMRSFLGTVKEPLLESARIIAPETWMNGDGDPSSRILEATQATASTVSEPSQGLGLLVLENLP